MTRKDQITIADCIVETYRDIDNQNIINAETAVNNLSGRLLSVFGDNNKHFNQSKFFMDYIAQKRTGYQVGDNV